MAPRLGSRRKPPDEAGDGAEGGEETPTIGHNSEEYQRILKKACCEVASINRKIDKINAEKLAELEPFKTERREILHGIIKGQLGMKLADFNVAMRMLTLGGEDQQKLFDTIRSTFAALGKGEQASFLPALDDEKPGGEPDQEAAAE